MSFLSELILQHAKTHLVHHDVAGSHVPKVSEFTLDSVQDSLKGSWLSSLDRSSSNTFITIKELLAWRRVVHSHSDNAQCLGETSTLHKDHTDHLGLKPLKNEKVFLVAWLKTGHSLHCQGESGDQGCVAMTMTTDDEFYLKDETGSVQCQASFCNWRWLDQALLVPCWNFIPGADARVRSMIEICPLCTPVVVSSDLSDRLLDFSQRSVSVERALRILQRHDSSRHAVNDVHVTGIVVNKSPIISVRGNNLFFFRMASDVSGKLSIPILAKEKPQLVFLHKALPMYASCSVTHLRPTTMVKGAKQPHHVFMCKKETTVTDVKYSCDDKKHGNSITGTVSKCIDASSGIYELDGKCRLYLCYQMDDTGPSTAVLRVGSVITIYNAHHHPKTLPEMPRVVCCMRSSVHIDRFSPRDSGPRKKLSPSPSGMVRVLLQYSLTLSELDWLSDVMNSLERKFSPTYLRKRALHTLLWRLFNTPSTESKKPLLRGKKRNIYEEFLSSSHSCHASREVEKSPPWHFPDLAEVSQLGHDQEDGEVDVDDGSSLQLSDSHFKVTESKHMKPPRILLGYLHLNPSTGRVQLKDQTGCVDCIITNTIPYPQTNGHRDEPTDRIKHSCHPPVVTKIKLGKSVERRCSWTCYHMHTWCLGHLIRVEGFLIIQEALSLILARPSPGSDETCVPERICSSGRVIENQSSVVFSMQSVECLNCEASATSSRVPHGKSGTHNRTKTPHSNNVSTRNLQGEDLPTSNLTSDKTARTEKDPKVPNNDSLRKNFLLLRKSQLISNSEGSLFFYAQVLPLEDLTLEEQASETLASCSEGDIHSGVGVRRFNGSSVRWYNTLHCGCAYMVRGETTKITKDELLHGTSLSLRELMLMDCDNICSVSEDVILQQVQANLLPAGSVNKLEKARTQFRNCWHVKGVSEVPSHKASSSDGLVSFHGRIITRTESMNDEKNHCNKKIKTSHHQPRSQAGENLIKFVIAHPDDTSSTLDVHITKSSIENTLGLIPGAYVTFRNCRLCHSTIGSVYSCSFPWTTVTVDCIPNDIKSFSVQDAHAKDESQSSDLSQSSESSLLPRRYYISQLLGTPDIVSPSQVIIINCHLQTVKYLSLKWSCLRCGHKDCVCSSSDGQTGGITASIRFMVEDGSGEAIVWCSVNSCIASLLGMTENRWLLLEHAVRQCQEVVYSYKPEDFNKEMEMPESSSDIEGWLSVLCSHKSIQKPLVLHCQTMVFINRSNNPNTGEGPIS
ncbi:CST complex subunit CTC1-like [Asterias rubens]|uniref:CST complex subunit CTC1-like n=1 Tax=Asterias rubens TaxID=7604 RepID=UPI0014550369|nr:CST complex subunit CTC1-like [Asterias rubens]